MHTSPPNTPISKAVKRRCHDPDRRIQHLTQSAVTSEVRRTPWSLMISCMPILYKQTVLGASIAQITPRHQPSD
jgi:hypothetical protein